LYATLYEGSGVVTTRNDVNMVVTEYGVAHLRGKSIRERAQALIRDEPIPAFRDELTYAAPGSFVIALTESNRPAKNLLS
jgi:4-hydroxybutyrate CoA-transferase